MKHIGLNVSNYENILKDKKAFLTDFVETNLSRTAEMFSYGGMPKEIPIFVYERILQKSGAVCVFKHNDEMHISPFSIYGEPNEYNEPKQVLVVNPYLDIDKGGFEKIFTVGEDCAIVKNDSGARGLLPLFTKYGLMARSAELTLDVQAYLSRIPFLITSKNSNTRDSAERFLSKIADGEYGVIGGNEFFDTIKTDTTPSRERGIADIVELANYVQSRLMNEIGILADYNGMKKERTSGADTKFAQPSLIPFVENMLNERKQGWERASEIFGLNVEVAFNSVWQMHSAFLERLTAEYSTSAVNADVEEIDTKGQEGEEANASEANASVQGDNSGTVGSESGAQGERAESGNAEAEAENAEQKEMTVGEMEQALNAVSESMGIVADDIEEIEKDIAEIKEELQPEADNDKRESEEEKDEENED